MSLEIAHIEFQHKARRHRSGLNCPCASRHLSRRAYFGFGLSVARLRPGTNEPSRRQRLLSSIKMIPIGNSASFRRCVIVHMIVGVVAGNAENERPTRRCRSLARRQRPVGLSLLNKPRSLVSSSIFSVRGMPAAEGLDGDTHERSPWNLYQAGSANRRTLSY
jgi:hypothetical protein